jgi:SAM-dependent methyltransferase
VSTDDWNQHWKAYAESAAANPAQAYRRRLIFRALDLARAPKPVRLLEIGSGQGDLSRELKERHPELELVGIDVSEMGVQIARSTALFFSRTSDCPSGFRSAIGGGQHMQSAPRFSNISTTRWRPFEMRAPASRPGAAS